LTHRQDGMSCITTFCCSVNHVFPDRATLSPRYRTSDQSSRSATRFCAREPGVSRRTQTRLFVHGMKVRMESNRKRIRNIGQCEDAMAFWRPTASLAARKHTGTATGMTYRCGDRVSHRTSSSVQYGGENKCKKTKNLSLQHKTAHFISFTV
jgi:hypothetical protein